MKTKQNMIIKKMKTSDIQPANYNPRDITEHAFQGLVESLKKFGLVEPLIVNKKTGNLVGGHQRLKAAQAIGIDEVPIVEVDLSPAEEKALNITLNNQAISGHFTDGLQVLLDEIKLDLGDNYLQELRLDELYQLDLNNTTDVDDSSDSNNNYTKKIEAPIYTPKGEQPSLSELCDTTKTCELLAAIKIAPISEDEKEFLRRAAQRHNVFRYDKIAEYYCHASKETQQLMENSALVIIDLNKAIENGFVSVTKDLVETFIDSSQKEIEDEE